MEYRILEDGHVVFVVEVLVETQYSKCQKWLQRKCSGIKGSTIKVSKSFVYRGYTDQPTSMDRTSMDIGDGANLDLVDITWVTC